VIGFFVKIFGRIQAAILAAMFVFMAALLPMSAAQAQSAPTITSVSPAAGPEAGGTSVVITGTNFDNASLVRFGGLNATSFTVDSSTSITAVTPSINFAQTVNVEVATPNGTAVRASSFSYRSPPFISFPSGISPDNGPTTGGTSITIDGNHFFDATVTIGGVAATITSNTGNRMIVTAPANSAGSKTIVITTPGGTESRANGFRYFVQPVVTSITPDAGSFNGGNTVTITGTGFDNVTQVRFNGTPATNFVNNGSTQITVQVPSGSAGSARVELLASDAMADLFNAYTYLAPPQITSISPNDSPIAGGGSVIITGDNFGAVTSVTFGGIPAASYVVNTQNRITAVTPARAAGVVDVTVVAGGGTATRPGFVFAAPPPTITSISPNSGSANGGTTITITGTNLLSTTAVRLDGGNVTSFTVVSDTEVRAVTQAGPPGPAQVSVQTLSSTAVLNAGFTRLAAPTINFLSPSTGGINGGTLVSINGNNLLGVTAVTFGGVPATSFNVVGSNSISAVTPPGAALGGVAVSVTSPTGTSTQNNGFTYTSIAPVINFISPNAGTTAGGNRVSISGQNFSGATSVTFGGVPALYFSVSSPSQIVAYPAAGTLGAVDVAVTTPNGSVSSPNGYTYTDPTAPTVTGLNPGQGTLAGGNEVTIFGANFTGATGVTIGGIAVPSFTVVDSTRIVAVAPAGSATGTTNVVVTTPNGTASRSGGYFYVAAPSSAPTITSVSPSTISVDGGSVNLNGANFTGVTSVTFNGVPGTSISEYGGGLSVVAPAGSVGPITIAVTTSAGTGTNANSATYIADRIAVISSVSPAAGPNNVGTTVTLTGTNFTGATSVRFGGRAATSFSVISPTEISAVTPVSSDIGNQSVFITTPGGTSTPTINSRFAWTSPLIPAATISAVSPNNGAIAGGTSVTITGTNFSGAAAVRFGSVAATSFTVVSPTQITAVTPAGSAGAVDIAVTTLGGLVTSNNAFTYGSGVVAAPTITSVAPISGTTAGGTNVVITGTNFTGATAVSFGSTAATSFTVDSATQITAVSPAGSAGAVNLSVTTSGGTATSNGAFTYATPQQPAPTIMSVAPTSGTTAGGTNVVITGTNFTGATAVSFGSTAATSFTVDSATQITAVSPAGSAGAVNLSVTTPGGTATSNGAFTYATPSVAPTVTSPSNVSVAFNSQGTAIDLTSSVSGVWSSIAVATAPANGTTSIAGNVVTYRPRAGYYGTDSFTFTATGPGGTSAPASVTLTIATPVAPTAAARSGVNVALNTATTIDLSSSVSGVASSVAVATAPTNGTTSVAGFVITYTPTAGYVGADSFTYTATGPGGTSAPAIVSVAVTGSVPAVQPQSATASDGAMVSVELTRGATFGPFTAARVTNVSPANAVSTVITSTGDGATRRYFVEATPAARFSGTITINYTLANSFGVSPVGVVTLTVAGRPDPASDRNVRALTDAQVQATRRFGRSQIANFMRRNEQLHSGRARSSENINVNIIDPSRERRPEDSMAPTAMPKRDSDRAAEEATAATAVDQGSPKAQDEKPTGVLGSMSVWLSGAIDIATRDATTFAPKLSATTQGISGGVDFQISKSTAIGFGGGYGNVTTDISGKAAELRATSNLVAVYGSTKLLQNGFVDVVAGRGFLDYKTRRRIDGTELRALGTRTGTMNLAAVSFGINKQIEGLDWSFFSKLEYMDANLAAYTETSGGTRNNLRLSALDDTSYSAGVGFRLQKAFATDLGQVTPRLRSEFGREFGKANVQYVDYADINDTAWRSINLRQTDRNYFETSIGTMIDLKSDWSVDLEYGLTYNTATLSTGIKVQLSRAF
jgi:hypothetical protein